MQRSRSHYVLLSPPTLIAAGLPHLDHLLFRVVHKADKHDAGSARADFHQFRRAKFFLAIELLPFL